MTDRGTKLAYALALLALIAVAGIGVRFFAGSALTAPTSRVLAEEPPKLVDVPIAVPQGWNALPVVARYDAARTSSTFTDHWMSGTRHWKTTLDDVSVSWDEDVCTAGGSSCTGDAPDFSALRVGDLDDDGRPMIDTQLTCQAVPAYIPQGPDAPQCSMASLALRKTSDGAFIVTLADPTEKVIASFRRSPVRPGIASTRARSSLKFTLFPIACFVLGVIALQRARRYTRFLSFRSGTLASGILEIDGKRLEIGKTPSIATRVEVLVDPAVLEASPDGTYRSLPKIDHVVLASPDVVRVRASMAKTMSIVALSAAAISGWVMLVIQ